MKFILIFASLIKILFFNNLLSQNSDSLTFNALSFSSKKIKVYIIPVGVKIKRTDISALPSYFQKAKIEITPSILVDFNYPNSDIWENPSNEGDHYTEKMKKVRDIYFKTFSNRDQNAYYCFIVPAFNNKKVNGFSIPTKGMCFVSKTISSNLSLSVAAQLKIAMGITFENDSSSQQTDPSKFINWNECLQIRANELTFGIYDDYEVIRTSNGLAAYYFWEEGENGEIEFDSLNPLNSIIRPYKLNTIYHYLDVKNWFFKPRFLIFDKQICFAHITPLLLSVILLLFFRRKLNLKIIESAFLKRMSFRLVKLLLWGFPILIIYTSFYLVDYYYKNSYLQTRKLPHFEGEQVITLQEKLKNTALFLSEETKEIQSQVYIKKKNGFVVEKHAKVLYFNELEDNKIKFHSSSNRLNLKALKRNIKAVTHYVVIRKINKYKRIKTERIFNHLGIEISKHVAKKDLAKRILIFVNGYRPVSISNSFEKNMEDIQSKGLEYPNSRNHLFDFDRFNYWRPWKEIDLLFQARINPDATWYADGHHSVATSNHGSVLNFSSNSLIYPKPCKNLKQHHCKLSKNTAKQSVNTYSLLATNENNDGFIIRRKKGEIAGTNLFQILNELPNYSKNDTLFIVAHSMGFAYSLGIIDKLRGKINFGGLYVIAPENAQAGKVNTKEWNDIIQYGCDLLSKNKAPSCLQDGIAPQSSIYGLSAKEHVYFPMNLKKRMGFLGSHFIGNYTWILDIPINQKGHIQQH